MTHQIPLFYFSAGSHKERVRYNGKLAQDAKEIKAAVAEYNKLVTAAPLYGTRQTGTGSTAAPAVVTHTVVTHEQIFAAEFPWVAEDREGTYYF